MDVIGPVYLVTSYVAPPQISTKKVSVLNRADYMWIKLNQSDPKHRFMQIRFSIQGDESYKWWIILVCSMIFKH